jgi:eukaryotic translation initiation factor 2C
VFGIKAKESRPAMNVGSDADPMWYAQEVLRIVPYQIYTKTVSDHLAGALVQSAAYHPTQSQWLIEHEGLKQMGFGEIKNEAIQMVNY